MARNSERSRSIVQAILSKVLADCNKDDYAIRLWDGAHWYPAGPQPKCRPSFTLVLNHPSALRSILTKLTMLNIGQEYLRGSFDIEGDICSACELGDHLLHLRPSIWKASGILLQLISLPRATKMREVDHRADLSGKVGSRNRLRKAISYHYDLPVGFWKSWLDPTLAYSCAYFREPSDTLESAQTNKLDYVCRKLYLSKGERFLDLGCGWGGLVLFAAQSYDVHATGITLSRRQAEYGNDLIMRLGLQKRCEILHLDFRDFRCTEQFDKIACVGAIEHVPFGQLNEFFAHAKKLLRPGGLFLNHGISVSADERHPPGPSFVDAFVFPDHGVTTIGRQLMAAEQVGFEIRDVECLREHYTRTCCEWLRRIEKNEVDLKLHSSGLIYRLFRLYVGAQAYYFRIGANGLYQTLFAKLQSGVVHIPPTRASWYDFQRTT